MDYDKLVKRLRASSYFGPSTEAADAIVMLRRERDEALAAQGYLYIGRDGKPILARDLEDQRDAALARAEQAEEDAETIISLSRKNVEALEIMRRERDAEREAWNKADLAEAKAARERDALRALLREAVEVLEPVAKLADRYDPPHGYIDTAEWVPVTDLRRARALLANIKIEIDNVDGQKKD